MPLPKLFTFYDSVPCKWPSAEYLALYVDGRYANADKAPKSAWYLTITVLGGEASVFDIERGDGTPAQGASWAKRQQANGAFATIASAPTLYCARSNAGNVIGECSKLKLQAGVDYYLWIAQWDNTPSLPDVTGCVAKQYSSGPEYDANVGDWNWLAVPRWTKAA